MRGQFKPNPQVVPNMTIIPGLFSALNNRVSGKYYGILGGSIYTSTKGLIADRLYAFPFFVVKSETFDRIAISVSTEINPSAVRLGIYYDNGLGAPAALLLDAGAIDSSTTGVKALVINQLLLPGLYWLTMLTNGAITVTAYSECIDLTGIGSSSYISGCTNYYTPQAYGELPNPHPSPDSDILSKAPAIALRRA
jgi:hypothetical protein